MAAYLKTDMPFYGVKRPLRKPIERAIKRRFPPSDHESYLAGVRALWTLPHREEKYTALAYARSFPRFITTESMPLYEEIIRQGAWWDLVDETAAHLVGRVWQHERDVLTPQMRRWSRDDHVWIRRTAIIGQLRHKGQTDAGFLFWVCAERAHETPFWIRKAIGWALRDFSKTSPDAVKTFLIAHRETLSGLSYREGARHLVRVGLL